MSLATIQAAMIDSVRGGRPGGLVEEIRATKTVSAAARLRAYRDVVVGGHLAALAKAYPVLREVLGGHYFDHLLAGASSEISSDERDLNRYGARLPDFMEKLQRRREELTDMPYLGDLARLEWAVHDSTLSADDPPCDWTGFAAATPAARSAATLRLSSALRLLTVNWPVDAIWASHNSRPAPETRRVGSIRLCIYRAGRFNASVTRITGSDYRLLERIARGANVGELGGTRNQSAERVVRTIIDWTGLRWIVGHEPGVADVR